MESNNPKLPKAKLPFSIETLEQKKKREERKQRERELFDYYGIDTSSFLCAGAYNHEEEYPFLTPEEAKRYDMDCTFGILLIRNNQELPEDLKQRLLCAKSKKEAFYSKNKAGSSKDKMKQLTPPN